MRCPPSRDESATSESSASLRTSVSCRLGCPTAQPVLVDAEAAAARDARLARATQAPPSPSSRAILTRLRGAANLPTIISARRLHYDYADYLAALEQSALKLEYCDGVIYAMAGGTRAHAELAASVIVALHAALPRSCRVATSDLKVRVEATDLSAFPDASVTCGASQTSAIDANALVNPKILVEVTSRPTEDYKRGDKLSHYEQLESLRAVLLVSHETRRITLVERNSEEGRHRWEERELRGGAGR